MMEMNMSALETFDVVVVGGGPTGATAAGDLAKKGRKVLLLDRMGRIKPCGGAIPPRLIKDFEIPDELLVAKASCARMIAPSDKAVDMPIEGGFVGMVDRDKFDEFLRVRAANDGAERRTGVFEKLSRDEDGCSVVHYVVRGGKQGLPDETISVRARAVIGADGAKSGVGRQAIPGAKDVEYVFAYHEIVKVPDNPPAGFDGTRCDVFYQGALSPDFYGWIFPHGKTMSIGTGTADKGFSLRGAVTELKKQTGLENAEMLRHEGAPLPMKPLKKWDNGRDVVLAGDAAGVVAPASGEGIYYGMYGGRVAAEAVEELLVTGNGKVLAHARKRFMKEHGTVFLVLGIMQRFWYNSDKRRERFVKMCEDKDVQRLTFEAYMNKKLVRRDPMAHLKIFLKDTAHLLGFAKV
jgi:geranylgeranyl diphosphate/geranylgeranyl-bacteriochlorophyllide a reductase